MKVKLLWAVGAAAAGILVASLVTGPYDTVSGAGGGGAVLLQSAQLDTGAAATLRRTCGNCHSNQTEWPWYSHVAPVSWLLRKDVSNGRKFLNFSVWPEYGAEGQAQLLALAAAQIKGESMPPRRYLVLHAEARLSHQERSYLIAALERESARVSGTIQSSH